MANSKSKQITNKLLPFKTVWHTVGLWIPDALIKCRDRNRHDRLWCNSPDKYWTMCWQSVFFPSLLHSSFFLSPSALTAFQGGSKGQGTPVVQPRGFISTLGPADFVTNSNDKEEFQHEKIWHAFYFFLSKDGYCKQCTHSSFMTWGTAHTCTAVHTKVPLSSPVIFSPFPAQTYSTSHVPINFQITWRNNMTNWYNFKKNK